MYIMYLWIHNYDFFLSGEHSKITLNTQNVFIESTATDLHKVTFSLKESRFKPMGFLGCHLILFSSNSGRMTKCVLRTVVQDAAIVVAIASRKRTVNVTD